MSLQTVGNLFFAGWRGALDRQRDLILIENQLIVQSGSNQRGGMACAGRLTMPEQEEKIVIYGDRVAVAQITGCPIVIQPAFGALAIGTISQFFVQQIPEPVRLDKGIERSSRLGALLIGQKGGEPACKAISRLTQRGQWQGRWLACCSALVVAFTTPYPFLVRTCSYSLVYMTIFTRS